MCGIFGTNRDLKKKDIENVLGSLAARGPDGHGVSSCSSWTLLHTRLAIFDLSDASAQPMRSSSGEMLSYNGEIFNFKRLGGKASDTKFIFERLKHICETQKDLTVELNRWNGFFAFAFVDKTETLTLVRDRFGEKPLFIYVEDNSVEFSSSLSALRSELRDKGAEMAFAKDVFKKRLSKKSSCLYETGVRKIYELRPGCYVRFDNRGNLIEQVEWYDLNSDVEKYSNQPLDEVITDAIRIRMEGDRPVALTLSGGVDSTTIASVIANYWEESLYFSYSSSHHEYDELETVKGLAKRLGISDRLRVIDENDHIQEIHIEEIENAFFSMGEVYFDPNFAQRALYKEISKHGFPVSVDGHGADELFLGYQWHVPIIISGLLFQGNLREALKLTRYFFNSYPNNYSFLFKGTVFLRQVLRGLLQSKKLDRRFGYTFDGQKALLFVDFFDRVLPKLLKNYDAASMSQSVESRSPFLDHRVVAIVVSKPLTFFAGDANKNYLRKFLKNSDISVPIKKIGLRSYFWHSVPDQFLVELVDRGYLEFEGDCQKLRDFLTKMSPAKELKLWQKISLNVLNSKVCVAK